MDPDLSIFMPKKYIASVDTHNADLAYALERVLTCELCHGHGKRFRRGGPDVRCECRTEAWEILNEHKGES